MIKDPSQILRLPAVSEAVGLTRSSIYRLMDEGLFPRPVKLSPRAVGWRRGQIDEWLATRPTAAAE
jgi:prophage regulatory protein